MGPVGESGQPPINLSHAARHRNRATYSPASPRRKINRFPHRDWGVCRFRRPLIGGDKWLRDCHRGRRSWGEVWSYPALLFLALGIPRYPRPCLGWSCAMTSGRGLRVVWKMSGWNFPRAAPDLGGSSAEAILLSNGDPPPTGLDLGPYSNVTKRSGIAIASQVRRGGRNGSAGWTGAQRILGLGGHGWPRSGAISGESRPGQGFHRWPRGTSLARGLWSRCWDSRGPASPPAPPRNL